MFLQDPVGLLPQHRLVYAYPRYGHVQRDPYLRHDKWHLLQVRHQPSPSVHMLLYENFAAGFKFTAAPGQSQPPIITNCPNTFPKPQYGFNGWISILKSILGSLCREYHYVFLPRIPSRVTELPRVTELLDPIPSLPQSFICIHRPVILPGLPASDCIRACEAVGGMTNKMLSLQAWLRGLSSSPGLVWLDVRLAACSLHSPDSPELFLSSPRVKHFYLIHRGKPVF